jgi:hypothetical protein
MWWQCKKCGERVDNNFETCWNCGANTEGVEDPSFRKVNDGTKTIPERLGHRHPLTCLRCQREMRFLGTKSFHEGTRWGALGDLGEMFVAKMDLEMFCCTQCGRVEFYAEDIFSNLQKFRDRLQKMSVGEP